MSGELDRPPLRIRVPPGEGRSYPVHVGRGSLERLGTWCAEAVPAHRYVVIADGRVAELYGRRALESLAAEGLRADLLAFPPGEGSKSSETWTGLTGRLLAAGVGRDAAVVALGGGVTGDLAGFVAATYMRGVPLVMVPTSLLAMLDSSVGGKTGIDAAGAKNVVGAYLHPRLVLVDPEVLRTLAPRHLRAGLAEAAKTAAIRDEALFTWIEGEATALRDGKTAALEALVERCLRIKADVVEADPEEAGLRQVLNFGHTAGHALEALSDFTLLHGEAVAAGMRIEARLGEAVGLTERGTASRLDAVLRALGAAEVPLEPISAEDLLAAASHDKKARRGRIRWVLLERLGAVARAADGAWSHELPRQACTAALEKALRATADVRDSAS